MDVSKVPDFNRLLNSSPCDRILVSPGARDRVPAVLPPNPRVLRLQMELGPEDLEIARIRTGVIL
jgi:hypothetical protein